MSIGSIQNIARIIDAGTVVGGDTRAVSNELYLQPVAVDKYIARGSCRYSDSELVQAIDSGRKSETRTQVPNSLAFFFARMCNFRLSESNEVPDKKTVSPSIIPHVLPERVVPAPNHSRDIPGLSSKRNGAKADNIWSGFRQGPDGNCVTVSAIKAAMHRFGQSPTDIYKEVKRVDGGYRVIMRDDFQLTLSDRELAAGARGSRFVGQDKDMLKDAHFLFAVSAKRAQMENNDGMASRSFQAAIHSLNDGEDERGPGEGFMRLGLKKHMKRVSVRDLARGQVGMCNRTGHSAAVINGREEMWGRKGAPPTRGDAVALM